MSDRVTPGSFVTLHYRLATADDVELVSTFDASPATLQLGSGQLAPPLEACLEDLPVGERHIFLLEPEQAFGPHNPQLVQCMARKELPGDGKIEVHALVEFAAPDGSRFTGLVRELDADSALIDFNHPLAGKSIRFEVEVIGVL
ncbi:FKBP-type 16 kDa peptidyl-prolyl cis-trans isomerase [Rhodocyclaceae bacterium]|nr:FKBP-type 16 kDa peptidyl-prolyl cis-trans isomerase [Rhodocyclaceae bacterium]